MKKTFLITMLFALSLNLTATEPPQDSAKPEAAPQPDSLPDKVCIMLEDSLICLPTRDGKEATEIITAFVKENKSNWPKNLFGWIGLLVAFSLSAPGIALISKGKNIYAFLKVFLRSKLNVVAFIAALASALLTSLFGLLASNTGFDWSMFGTIWGLAAFAAIKAYHKWFETKEDIERRLASKK